MILAFMRKLRALLPAPTPPSEDAAWAACGGPREAAAQALCSECWSFEAGW